VAERLLFTYVGLRATNRGDVFGDPALLEVWQERTAL
jgi:hypothetical protein